MSLDAIGISCADLNKSIQFYNLLGIQFKEFGEGHYEGKTSSGMRIMLDSFELLKKINSNWKAPVQPGITLCFLQQDSSQVDQIYKKIIDQNFNSEKQPWDAFWGQRYASEKDPDNNQIDLFAPL
jgi:uncharacterized glyoxalase superfamily protein PhnB